MKGHLFFFYYFNFLIKIVINIYFYEFNPCYNLKNFFLYFNRYEFKFTNHVKARYIRSLSDPNDDGNKDTLNNVDPSKKGLKILYNRSDTTNERTSPENFFVNSKKLFIELINKLFFTTFEECLEKEKIYLNSTYDMLESIKNEKLHFFQSSLKDTKSYIDEIFLKHNIHYENELKIFEDSRIYITDHGNTTKMYINGIQANKYLEQIKLNKKYSLKINNFIYYFGELFEKNKNFIYDISNRISSMNKYISYLGSNANRFPLKYAHSSYNFHAIQDDSIKSLLEILYNIIINNNKRGINSFTSLKINITYLKYLIDEMSKKIDLVMSEAIKILFEKINEILKGDKNFVIAFFAYIFKLEISKNNITLNNIKKEHKEKIYTDTFLFDIYNLFLQEKREIKDSQHKFKILVESLYGLDVNSPGILSLVKIIHESNRGEEITDIFKIVTHSLLCKKQLNEYSNFLNWIEEKSKGRKPYIKRCMYCIQENDEGVIYITKNFYDNLRSNFLQMHERNYFINNLQCSTQLIKSSLKSSEGYLKRYVILNELIFMLDKELLKSKEFYFASEEEKRPNKNAILFLLYTIRNFDERYVRFGN